MNKTERTPRQKNGRFWLAVGIYAEVFLILTVIGLFFFWDYMAAYEASRPANAIEDYMETVTAQRLSTLDTRLIGQIDHHIQSEEACRQAIADSLEGNFSYAKNVKLTTDDALVYMISQGGKTLGSVTMTVVRTDSYGFDYWAVTEESYDFSYLTGESVSITVPEDYLVYANGVLLEESYLTESDIHYPCVEEYYDRYDLPTMSTYTAGPILGEVTLTVTDPQGQAVTIDENTDMEQFLKNCSQQELEAVETFLGQFVQCYTDFTSVTGGQGAMQRNYNALAEHMVTGGALAQRMKEAIAGLTWVTDRNASVSSVTVTRCLRLEEGRYLVDFTYVVDTRDYSGKVESESSVQMTVVSTDDGLKAESMTSK